MTLRAADVAGRLAAWPGLRFVMGAAASGKSTASTALARRRGLPVLDVDERLYGSWHGRFDPDRHPACHAWSTAPDPLAWQLAMDPATFLAFHDTSTLEALDLLAEDLEADLEAHQGADRNAASSPVLLVDGGFGSIRSLAAVVDPATIVCVVPAPILRASAWTADAVRHGFLDMVAGVGAVPDPVGRFLALDAALAARMEADALATGARRVDRRDGDTVDALVDRVEAALDLV